MSTVEKAIALLEMFSATEPELGLSDLARKAAFDKATTRRLLIALSSRGLVEQDAGSRRYRLGAGVSRLARIRDARFPYVKVASPVIRELAQETGETVHLSEYTAGSLLTVFVELSARANRVNVDVGQVLPLHGTASGLAFLAFSRPETVETYFQHRLTRFTPHTVTSRDDIMKAVRTAAARGYSRSAQGYEEGVHSVSARSSAPTATRSGRSPWLRRSRASTDSSRPHRARPRSARVSASQRCSTASRWLTRRGDEPFHRFKY